MKKSFVTMLAVYLGAAMMLFTVPGPAWAVLIPAARSVDAKNNAAIQRALESSLVMQRLVDLGLSPEEAAVRVGALSDEAVHGFASRMDSLQAGDDGVEALVVVVLALILVAGFLELTGHSVVIR